MADDGQQDQGNDNGQSADDKKFTQAEVDAIVLKRAERVAADKYSDHADLKAKAARLAEIEEANASELDKAIKKARDEAATEVRTEITRERVLDKIEVAAAGKFADVTDARLRIGQQAADFIKSDGSIDFAAIKAAVDKQLEDAPHLKAATTSGRPKPDPSQGGSAGTPSQADQGRAEARKRFGASAGQH